MTHPPDRPAPSARPDRLAKLFALDEDDLAVVSMHVQDAVAKVSDIVWSPPDGHFSIPMNRFVWEGTLGKAGRRGSGERRRSVLSFARVEAAKVNGLNPADKDAVVSVLAVLFEPGDAPAGAINVVCAGDAVIRLEVECIEAQLTDLGAAWEAVRRPSHAAGRR